MIPRITRNVLMSSVFYITMLAFAQPGLLHGVLCSYFRKRDNYPEIGPVRAVWSRDNVCLIPDAARCANSLRIRDGKKCICGKKISSAPRTVANYRGEYSRNSQMTPCSKYNEGLTSIAFCIKREKNRY